MEQPGLPAIGVLAEVEHEVLRLGRDRQPRRPGLLPEVGVERYEGCLVRDRTELLPDDQVVRHEREHGLGARAHHRERGLLHLVEPGHRTSSHDRESLGQARGLDGVEQKVSAIEQRDREQVQEPDRDGQHRRQMNERDEAGECQAQHDADDPVAAGPLHAAP